MSDEKSGVSDPNDDEPPVTLHAATGGLTLVLRDDARLPTSMRWFYSCR